MASSAANLPAFDLEKSLFHHSSMTKYVKNWASEGGFIVVDHKKGKYNPSTWPFEYTFSPNTPNRGHFYCSPKSHGRAKRLKCSWRVMYAVTDDKVYKFTDKARNLTHCHAIAPKPIIFDGHIEVDLLN